MFTGAGYPHLCGCLASFNIVASSKAIAEFFPLLSASLTCNAAAVNAVVRKGELKDLSHPTLPWQATTKATEGFA